MAKKRSPRALRGKVIEAESGEPLPNHFVRAFDAGQEDDERQLGQTRTAADGSFVLKISEEVDEIDLRVFDTQRYPIGSLGPLAGARRFRAQVIQVSPRLVQMLNREMAKELEKFLKRPDILRKISKILSEEGDLDPNHVYEVLLKSDPFGMSPFTFRTAVCCLLYQLYDTFKQTSLASSLFFGGGRYRHMWNVTITGDLVGKVDDTPPSPGWIDEGIEGRPDIDEDWTFKIIPGDYTVHGAPPGVLLGQGGGLGTLRTFLRNTGRFSGSETAELDETYTNPTVHHGHPSEYFDRIHCEIIPCDQVNQMRRMMRKMENEANLQGAEQRRNPQNTSGTWQFPKVTVEGVFTFDPAHLDSEAHLEVHPVRNIIPVNF